MGMNPGAISALIYQAIESYCYTYRPELLEMIYKGEINKVASEVVDTGHISEYDNQETNKEFKSGWMINSWSSNGFVAEALCTSFISSGSPIPGYLKSKFNPRIYYAPEYKSMDCTTNSICLYPDGTPFEYIGRMITHFEVVSLSEYMSLGDYVPRLSYVYSSSPISQKCLEDIKQHGYKEPSEYYVFNQHDIVNKNSFDSLGACVYFRDGHKFWCGTVLTNEQTLKLLGYETRVNATQLQVAIAILAGIEWMLENPNRGVITAEEIPHKYILRRCIPYWGNFFCREIMSTGASILSTHVNHDDNYNDNYTIPANLIIDKL
jgi:homospermidine synthase